MSQGNDFANYVSPVGDQSTASEDVWFVAVSSDDIKQMNLDQLDEAFRLGIVTAQTAVWTEGMEAWAPLGEVADLDSHGESHAADQSEVRPAESHAASASGHVGPGHVGSGHVGSGHGYSAGSGSFGAGPSSFGPPTTSSFAPVTTSNMFSSAPSLSPSALGQSTSPVAFNVDEDSSPARRGRSWRPERWLLAVAGVVGAGVVGYNVMGSSSSSVAAAEKPAAAATGSSSHAYEPPPEHGTTRPAAVKEELPVAKADDGKDAPIGSVPSSSPEETKEQAAEAPSSAKGAKEKDSDSLRGGVAKAFNGKKGSSKASSSSGKSAKASKSHGRTPSRATASRATSSSSSKSSKKPGVAHTQSAFDPLNGSLP